MQIGFIEPHLNVCGGIRRVLETSNRLVEWGHDVTIYLPPDIDITQGCSWMPCRPGLKSLDDGAQDALDFIVFNHEPQWHRMEGFARARKRIFLALSYSRLYHKSGSWESLRSDVDAILANSRWTADHIESEIGIRPTVVPTGVDRAIFRPVNVPKSYPVLCPGEKRLWKGSAVIEEACCLLGLPLERVAGKGLRQDQLANEICAAEIFVVGSPLDGFGMPGLEALACGVPLVTTDNGGCREYAVHENTALIVPPDDPSAMAEAILRLRTEPQLAQQLRREGLRRASRFTWDDAARGFERELLAEHERPLRPRAPSRPIRRRDEAPLLSIVVLNWNNLKLTQRCVQSIRQYTAVPYELVLVDNGSEEGGSASYMSQAADTAILNETNIGFSAAFNQGLERARGEYIAFLNNDTVLPEGWATTLVQTLVDYPNAGIVFPAVTAASNSVTVRQVPGEGVTVLPQFLEPPSGVALVMRTHEARELEGWDERYEVASGEDTDLCFKVWVNDLTTLLDERVLVEHVNKASSGRLPDRRARWATNRRRFLEKWAGMDAGVPRLERCPPDRFAVNRVHARGVAFWMQRYFALAESYADGTGHRDLDASLRLERMPEKQVREELYRVRQKNRRQRKELEALRQHRRLDRPGLSRRLLAVPQWLRRARRSGLAAVRRRSRKV